jgi:hypothetical protein
VDRVHVEDVRNSFRDATRQPEEDARKNPANVARDFHWEIRKDVAAALE